MGAHLVMYGIPQQFLWFRHILLLLLLLLAAATPGHAQPYSDPAEGHRLATTWCVGCHQVEMRSRPTASDAIPSFPAIAEMPSTTMLSIHAFLRTSHTVMPDLKLTETQIDDLAAYIISLRPGLPE